VCVCVCVCVCVRERERERECIGIESDVCMCVCAPLLDGCKVHWLHSTRLRGMQPSGFAFHSGPTLLRGSMHCSVPVVPPHANAASLHSMCCSTLAVPLPAKAPSLLFHALQCACKNSVLTSLNSRDY